VPSQLFTNIGQLVTNDPAREGGILGVLTDAAFVVEDGAVVWVGAASQAPDTDESTDLNGAAVIPGFVDSHAHPVFAGDRAEEFAARMAGQSYSAGGIKSTVAATRAASEAQLEANLLRLKREFLNSGVTTFEAKSGYGLTTLDEARSLEIAARHTTETTYLGAHVVAPEFAANPDEYVALVTGEMLTAAAPHARWIDVFCDRGAFDVDQARQILTAGVAAGLKPRIHANQLTRTDAIQLAVELDCASADHCTHLTDVDVAALAGSNTVATLLPGAEFSTRSQYPNARALIDAGATVAIATDCNPGSSYTTSMAFCIALAVREMAMTPAEALWSATAGGAAALRRTDVGRLTVGSRADFAVLNAPSYLHLAYRPGVNLINRSYIGGQPA
jgi:imidazolonepropionase